MSRSSKDRLSVLHTLQSLWSGACAVPLTTAMHALLLIDNKITNAFDLSTEVGQRLFASWLLYKSPSLPGLYIQKHCKDNKSFLNAAYSHVAIVIDQVTLSVPAVIISIWRMRDDLQKAYPLDSLKGLAGVLGNLMLSDEQVRKIMLSSEKQFLLSPVGPLGIPLILYALWLERLDFQQVFDINTQDGCAELLSHALLNTTWPRILLLANGNKSFENAAYSHIDIVIDQNTLSVPVVIISIWRMRDDLQKAYPLDSLKGLAGLLGNLMLSNARVRKIMLSSEKRFLLSPVIPLSIPLILYALWSERLDLQKSFDINAYSSDPKSTEKLLEWLYSTGFADYPWLQGLFDKTSSEQLQTHLSNSHKMTRHYYIPPPAPQRKPTDLKNGINLIGYPYSASGLGEDLRMVARSLQATDIPFCVIETPLQVPSARCRFEFEAVTSRVPLYTITVICLPSGELYRAFVLFGYEFFEGQYVVGQMPWELSRWPNGHEVFLGLLDEAWALTSFIFKALKPVFRGPIVHMPRAVDDTPPDPAYTRADFGLPSEKYIFNFTYDGLSTSARKNPLTVLHAFQMAFPPSVTDVLLVFKSMNSIYDPFHYEILRVISGDTRIISIDETFPKEKLLALTKSCDVFVSLHRAEGFGLSIAEAMLLAKPVIVSDYSGNQDFCSTETAFLVDGEEVSVPKGAYFFSDGQRWFSPNIATAARLMRLCYENRHEAALCALQGQSFIRNHYSIKNIARNYVRRFNELIDYNFS